MRIETWRQVVGFEGIYEVSDNGNIRSVDRFVPNRKNKFNKGNNLKLKISNFGYARVGLCDGYSQKFRFVHRLVAFAFIPNPDNKPYINHIDGNKLNNCIENLEWVTAKENKDHASKNGFVANGIRNTNCALTENQVRDIRDKYKKRIYPSTRLSKEYSVSHSTILNIVKNKTWDHL